MSSSNELLSPGHVYHLWTHAVSNDDLFVEKENYRFFLSKYFFYTDPVLYTCAYCLMPNHIHFMVKVLDVDTIMKHPKNNKLNKVGKDKIPHFISHQIGHLFNSYTKSYNKRYSRRGSLFERPFGRKLIDSESYFAKLVIYIHRNPVKHGFVKSINEWPYSSWHSYVNESNDELMKEEILKWFGGTDHFINAHFEENEPYKF